MFRVDALQPNVKLSRTSYLVLKPRPPIDGGFVCSSCLVSQKVELEHDPLATSAEGKGVPEGVSQKESQQHFLWQGFFLDPSQWWDNRQDKRSSRHPDFRHKRVKQVLWLDNQYKPSWVDAELAKWDAQIASTSTSGSDARHCRVYERGLKVGNSSSALGKEELLKEAVESLELLVQRGCHVDSSLFYPVIKRCNAQKDLVLGKRVHALTVKSGHEFDAFLANHIICMYASAGELEEAKEVFSKVSAPNTYMWASIIKAHAEHRQPEQAIKLYERMRESGVTPDNHIFVAMLKACAIAEDLDSGRMVHDDILASAFEPDLFVGSSLVDMYAKCGSLEDARRVFDTLKTRNVVTWTAMIAGYAQQGLGQEALTLYSGMQQEGLTPANQATFVSLLQACTSVGAVDQGKQLHKQIQQRGLEADVIVGSCLVDMYAKCGRLDEAEKVFHNLPTKNVVTWNAMIGNSSGQSGIRYFEEMQEQGIKPDGATFACLLVACNHDGLVNEGEKYFKMMHEHGLTPTVQHYNCMVDLFGRSGQLEEAENILQTMPFEPDVVGWVSLLSACKTHGDLERGIQSFNQLIQLRPEYGTPYVLLGTMYANAGQWDDVDRIETWRRCAGAKKKPAKACIEVNSKVHEFTVGEETADISSKLRSMNVTLKEAGHVPHTEQVLKAVPERDKEDALCGHAEKLALAYGLLNTPNGTTLLVTKNLRMCNDCHSSTKIMSKLERREIIVRDSHRVHRFVGGACSCGDRH